MAPRKSPIDLIDDMLSERGDVEYSLASYPTRLIGVQLRRVWSETTRNPESMQPLTTTQWFYYGQHFVIYEDRRNAKDELLPTLAHIKSRLEAQGSVVVLYDPAKPLDAVIEALGPVPAEFEEYRARVQRPGRQPVAQPRGMV